MIKQILLVLLFTSLFTITGCVERGHTITPAQTKQVILKPKQSKMEQGKKPQTAPINVVDAVENSDDSLQNTIAGVLVFIIGVLVIL